MRRLLALSWHRPSPATLLELAAAFFLAGCCLGALVIATDLKTEGTPAFADPGWDRHIYIEMATTNPLDFHLSPYGWRILVPTIEHILPSDLQPTFFTITFVSLLGAALLLYA